MGGSEKMLIQEVFDTNWIAPVGPHINNFEKNFLSCVKILMLQH